MNLKRIFQIIEPANNGDRTSKVFDISIILLIGINIIAVILSSFSNLSTGIMKFLNDLELISIVIFTVEYLLRLLTSPYKFPNTKRWIPYLVYVFSAMAIIDLLAILPVYAHSGEDCHPFRTKVATS